MERNAYMIRRASFNSWGRMLKEYSWSDLARKGFYADNKLLICSKCGNALAENASVLSKNITDHIMRCHEGNSGDINAVGTTTHKVPNQRLNYTIENQAPPRTTDTNESLKTFEKWKNNESGVPNSILAKIGFEYKGDGTNDIIQCMYCNVLLQCWDFNNKIIKEHTIGGTCPIWRPSPRIGTKIYLNNAAYPEFSSEEVRVKSFEGQIVPTNQSVAVLANSGFYHVGKGDTVRCHYCTGTISCWLPRNDPWIEHCKYFPTCEFLRTKRDDYHIKLIRDKYLNGGDTSDCCGDGATVGTTIVTNTAITDTEEIIDSLLRENSRLVDIRTCKICLTEESNVVFLPCGHFCSCNSCAPKMEKCPVCRILVKHTVRVYFG